jgi:hypothetical protein
MRRGGAVLLGALAMLWPAFYNGYPLFYPDSMTYRPILGRWYLETHCGKAKFALCDSVGGLPSDSDLTGEDPIGAPLRSHHGFAILPRSF